MPKQPKVLVVDDEESVVVTIKAILQLDGYSVATTTSCVEARAMVREVEYDLVLTDLRLEDGDGLDVLKTVRERHPETVTIMLTGYASLESAIQALRAGAYDRARSKSFAAPWPAGSSAAVSGRSCVSAWWSSSRRTARSPT